MRVLGPCLVIALYLIVAVHFYAYVTIISPLLKKRIGTTLGLIWISVGLALVYNIVFNHFLATVVKAGGPSDLRKIERMR